ncbi:MAG: CinA family protein [Epsilonproteobacteria bacterium]|nr:CinA family protein [Campylobacterota bacterium]
MEQKQLLQNIINALREQKQTITFAESCTGGRIAAAFTTIGGASDVFNGSVVSYSNNIKHKWLGVRRETLENFGAVSEHCVNEMLTGIVKMAYADYAMAVSGIAGPNGGTELKPVGTVFIGIIEPSGATDIHHCLFKGSREAIQNQSVDFAINLIAKKLNLI